jgi:hypothetical protein
LWGVPNLVFTLPKKLGSRPSLLNGTKDLDAVIIPALAVDKNARMAAIPKAILPTGPMKTSAPSDIGVSD